MVQLSKAFTASKLAAIGAVIAGFALFTWAGFKYTSRPKFCMSCHEIAPSVKSWETSSHSSVSCLACHSEPGKLGYVKRKVFGLREVYVHLAGRKEDIIRARVDVRRCLECHGDVRQRTETAGLRFSHQRHLELIGTTSCLKCHSRVVHGPGPMTPGGTSLMNTTCASCHDVKSPGGCGTCHKKL